MSEKTPGVHVADEIRSQEHGVSHAFGRPNFERLHVVRRRYHFHGPLVIYVLTTVVLVFGAINGQNNLLFWLFGLAVGGLIVSGFLSGAALMGIEVERELPDRAKVGEPLLVRYRVRNRNRLFPTCALVIEEIDEGTPHDSPSPGQPDLESWLCTFSRCASFVARVNPSSSATASCAVVPARRGQYQFNALRVWTTFPFGLTRKSVVFAKPQRVLVRPGTPSVRLPLASIKTDRPDRVLTGQRDREGEFFALRDYLPGDPVRSIAWRASARAARPVIRENSPPAMRKALIVLDDASDEPGLERIVAAAAGLIVQAAESGVSFGVSRFNGAEVVPMGSGPRQAATAMDVLAMFKPGSGGAVASSTPQRSRIIVRDRADHKGTQAGDIVFDASGVPLPPRPEVAGATHAFSPSRWLSLVGDALTPRKSA